MFALLAAFLFVLAAFGVHMGDVNLVALGLCSLAIAFLVGTWPLGAITIRRRN